MFCAQGYLELSALAQSVELLISEAFKQAFKYKLHKTSPVWTDINSADRQKGLHGPGQMACFYAIQLSP